jgi:hypothetical protein
MPSQFPKESLDLVEWVMAMEEALPDMDPDERERLILEIKERLDRGDLDDGDLDEGDLAALVRKLGPRGPRGQAGAAAKPEEPPRE